MLLHLNQWHIRLLWLKVHFLFHNLDDTALYYWIFQMLVLCKMKIPRILKLYLINWIYHHNILKMFCRLIFLVFPLQYFSMKLFFSHGCILIRPFSQFSGYFRIRGRYISLWKHMKFCKTCYCLFKVLYIVKGKIPTV